ncbi:ester cyclase [Promicromonospora thailandica]|uniref:Ester cyclase n=1 Tax=Promicromonospora thailandica TaxID=765201 RepID=A0A9X2GCK2_9MICO|nr:ester cyclase [Promicromonospora thailandica]MCP2266046.1 putative ester cyclase [Promicromonospora thailandica]BFF21357.1 ester cyclase [Promicromonospora thailandica]
MTEDSGETADTDDLEPRYLAYLAVLNERRFDDLARHVHDELTYNDERLTRQQYRDLIAADVAAAPDLFYDPRLLVVAGDQVACRLVFDTAPQGDFLGFAPRGTRLRFAEHVFYRYHDGRIAEVRSLIDRAAVAEQVEQAGRG